MPTSAEPPIRIAMWSGPRNISTALMRSWDARADTYVCDEPLYAHYLAVTGVEHPGRDDIIAAYETDWRKVVDRLTGSVPSGKAIFYQKHMAHHILPDMSGSWITQLSNGFLIRDPREMLISLARVMERPSIADTGLPQQKMLFDLVSREQDSLPPVVDARDVLDDPALMLQQLCNALEVPYTDAMLSWAPGERETDGIWARHWYGSVHASTCFRPYEPPSEELPDRLAELYDECRPYYDYLSRHRLTP